MIVGQLGFNDKKGLFELNKMGKGGGLGLFELNKRGGIEQFLKGRPVIELGRKGQ